MLHATSQKVTPKKARGIEGICTDAVTLGVNRSTLWRVLNGKWKSKSLLAEYQNLPAGRHATKKKKKVKVQS